MNKEYTEEDAVRELYRSNPGLKELIEQYEHLKLVKEVKEYNKGVRVSNRIKLGIKIFLFGVIPATLGVLFWFCVKHEAGNTFWFTIFGIGDGWGNMVGVLGLIVNVSVGVTLFMLAMRWLFHKEQEIKE